MIDSEVAFGFFDSDIPTLLERCPWFVSGCTCLLTCLDSNPDTARSPILRSLGAHALGQFALIPGERIIGEQRQLFFGFDELYVFEGTFKHDLGASIWTARYTSDRAELRDGIPSELLVIFNGCAALRYASNGAGLNILLRQPDELKLIAAASQQ